MSAIVPVVVFAYRRPDLLERALASLRANGVPLIYAYSDGPKDPTVAADVAAVRALLRAVDWTEITVVEQPVNTGLGESVLAGISTVLAAHETVIVCEEDMEFVPGTYAYLCAALERYSDDPRVMGVTAWNHPRVTPKDVTSDPYFSGRATSWLWGTWRRAWAGVTDETCASLNEKCRALGINVAAYGNELVESAIYEPKYSAMWDYRFNLHVLAQRGLFLWPARSMVRHNGYDPRASMSPNGEGWEDVPSPAPAVDTVRWPSEVRENPGSAPLWRVAVDAAPPPPFFARVRRRLRRFVREWSTPRPGPKP
jgi:hypothetical protein